MYIGDRNRLMWYRKQTEVTIREKGKEEEQARAWD